MVELSHVTYIFFKKKVLPDVRNMRGKRLLAISSICIMILSGFSLLFISEESGRSIGSESREQKNRGYKDPIWPMEDGNYKRNGSSKFNFGNNPGKVKKVYSQSIIDSCDPVIDSEGIIYIGGRSNDFYAIYPNGTTKWRNTNGSSYSTPAYTDKGFVIFITYPHRSLKCLFASNGTEKWNISGNFTGTPAIYEDGTIYVFSHFGENINGTLFSFDLDGHERWNMSFGLLRYSFKISPTLNENGTIFILIPYYTNSYICWSYLFSINPEGNILWKTNISDMRYCVPPSIGPDGTIYCCDCIIYAFFPNGTLKWSQSTMGWIYATPVVDSKGNVYIASTGSDLSTNILSLDSNGNWRWDIYIGKPPDVKIRNVIVSNDGVLLVNSGESVLSINGSGPDGLYQWWVNISSSGHTTPIILNDDEVLFVGTNLTLLGRVPPSPPMNPTSTFGDRFVNISWGVPVDDGGSPILNYKVYRGINSGILDEYVQVGGNVHYFNDTDVINGNTYYYRITAINSEGESKFSRLESGTPVTVPSPPINFSVRSGDRYITISWYPPEYDGGSRITGYDVFKGESSETLVLLATLPFYTLIYNDTDVELGHTYYYSVRAINAAGSSDGTVIKSGIPLTLPTAPLYPYAISGDGYIKLGWSPPSDDGGSSIISYRIYQRTYYENETTLLYEVDNETFEYNDTSVENGVTYCYSITCVTDIGESPRSTEVYSTPFGKPSPPENLTAIGGDGYVELSWSLPDDDGGSEINQITIYRRVDASIEVIIISGSNITSYVDEFLTNGIVYYYRISVSNMIGESELTEEVEVVPLGLPSVPRNFYITGGDGFIHLYWEPPNNDGGTSINNYNIYRNSTLLLSVGSDERDYNDTGLCNGVTYYYSVSAVNSLGESYLTDEYWFIPNSVEPLYRKPSAPLNVSGELIDNRVKISWSSPLDNGGLPIRGYRLYRSVNSSDKFALFMEFGSQDFSYTDRDIIAGNDYYYRISAFNMLYEGNVSAIIHVRYESQQDNITENPENHDKNNLLIILLPVVFIIILLIVAIYYIFLRKERIDDRSMGASSKYDEGFE